MNNFHYIWIDNMLYLSNWYLGQFSTLLLRVWPYFCGFSEMNSNFNFIFNECFEKHHNVNHNHCTLPCHRIYYCNRQNSPVTIAKMDSSFPNVHLFYLSSNLFHLYFVHQSTFRMIGFLEISHLLERICEIVYLQMIKKKSLNF